MASPLPPTPAKSIFTATSTERDFESEFDVDDDYGDENQEDAVHFCLLAEFDIDAGATLTHQYPYPIDPTGTNEHRLAELMLPDGAHLRQEDWTIFYLGQTTQSSVNPMLSHELVNSSDPVSEIEKRASMLHISEGEMKRGVKGGGLLYVLNRVRQKEDKKMRRGAMVKAMAICTPNPYIGIYKPLLLLALDEYFNSPSPDILARLYDSANSISTFGMPVLTRNEKILLRASERKDMFEEKFGIQEPVSGAREYFDEIPNSEVGHGSGENEFGTLVHRRDTSFGSSRPSSAMARPGVPRKSSAGSSQGHMSLLGREGRGTPDGLMIGEVLGRRKGLPRDTHFFETEARFQRITVPIRIPMTLFDEDVGDYSLIELIQTFSYNSNPFPPPFHPHLHTNGANTHPIILLFNAMIANKRVIFLGPSLPANQVARMVLAACALGSGCGQVLRGSTEAAFPYSNLASIDIFEEFTGFVAGSTNPRFEELHLTWDVLCNLETGKITVSKNLQSTSGFGTVNSLGMLRSGRSSEVSLANSIVKVDEDGTTGTPQSKMSSSTRSDCVDNQFMDDTLAAINSHYGEANIRIRFTDYISRFVRLAAYHEYFHQGTTKIGYPVLPYSPLDGLGSGAVFADESTKQREMWVNVNRIDAWRKTKSYKLYQKDWQSYIKRHAIQGFDVNHQISRLRHAKKMSDGEAEGIFGALAQGVRSYEQVVELLTHMPPHWGGLIPIANGLFHRWSGIREDALELLTTIQQYPVGRQALSNLNYFHRKTYLQMKEKRDTARARQLDIEDQARRLKSFSQSFNGGAGLGSSPDHRYGTDFSDVATPETVHAARADTPLAFA